MNARIKIKKFNLGKLKLALQNSQGQHCLVAADTEARK